MLLMVGLFARPAMGQNRAEEIEIPAPEKISAITPDGVQIRATYYPGVDAESRGKDIVPIILLHDFKGSRNDMAPLAEYLQQLRDENGAPTGCAVIVPDLRAHGESILVQGTNRNLDPDRLRADQFRQMFLEDLEEIKKFLMRQNNDGLLNIEKLGVVGAGMGAMVALYWSEWDWHWPPLPSQKQGRDVKALVLISPPREFKGLNAFVPLNFEPVRAALSMYLIVGEQSQRDLSDAQRIYDRLLRFHPEPPPEQARQLKDLFFDKYPTSLQGTQLLTANFNVDQRIASFIRLRLADQDLPWQDRRSPLSQ